MILDGPENLVKLKNAKIIATAAGSARKESATARTDSLEPLVIKFPVLTNAVILTESAETTELANVKPDLWEKTAVLNIA